MAARAVLFLGVTVSGVSDVVSTLLRSDGVNEAILGRAMWHFRWSSRHCASLGTVHRLLYFVTSRPVGQTLTVPWRVSLPKTLSAGIHDANHPGVDEVVERDRRSHKTPFWFSVAHLPTMSQPTAPPCSTAHLSDNAPLLVSQGVLLNERCACGADISQGDKAQIVYLNLWSDDNTITL